MHLPTHPPTLRTTSASPTAAGVGHSPTPAMQTAVAAGVAASASGRPSPRSTLPVAKSWRPRMKKAEALLMVANQAVRLAARGGEQAQQCGRRMRDLFRMGLCAQVHGSSLVPCCYCCNPWVVAGRPASACDGAQPAGRAP